MAFSNIKPNPLVRNWESTKDKEANKTAKGVQELVLIEQPWELCRVQERLTDKTIFEHIKVEATMKYVVPYKYFHYLRFLAQPILMPCTCNHHYQAKKLERFVQLNTMPLKFDFQGYMPAADIPHIYHHWDAIPDEARGASTYTQAYKDSLSNLDKTYH